MKVVVEELQRARQRELLAKLDRVATVSRGHRAGLHLYDRSLFDQYLTVLIAWEREVQGLSKPSVVQAIASVDPAIEQTGSPPVSVARS